MSKFAKFVLLGLALAGCVSAPVPQPPQSPSSPRPTPSATPIELSRDSIYHLSGEWQDHNGKAMELQRLRGRIRILAMFYASCKGACPRLIQDMLVLEKGLSSVARARVGFVLVTIDPDVDSPARLAQVAQERGLDLQRWQLLRGDLTQVQDLGALLGFRFRRTSATDYAHSNLISILNSEGELIHQQVGLGIDPAESLAVVQSLLEKEELPACCRE